MDPQTAPPKYQDHRLNTYIDPKLARIARAYFRGTRHRSISGFFEHALRLEFRRQASRLRALGLTLPTEILTK
jgi:hypothetical protein